jgi:hypothetical protein
MTNWLRSIQALQCVASFESRVASQSRKINRINYLRGHLSSDYVSLVPSIICDRQAALDDVRNRFVWMTLPPTDIRLCTQHRSSLRLLLLASLAGFRGHERRRDQLDDGECSAHPLHDVPPGQCQRLLIRSIASGYRAP